MKKYIRLFGRKFLSPTISNQDIPVSILAGFLIKAGAFFSLLFILCGYSSYSQSITNYTFAATSGTFTNITNGILPSAGGGTPDEGYGNSIPIGFDFWYMGSRYTTISASSNGWLSFGGDITNATPVNNLNNGGALRPVLAPLWDDLDDISTANVTYLTTGTAGSRIFTMEYLNVKWSRTATAAGISFQVKLYEGTGRIQFVYRPETGSLSGASSSIGISAATTGSGNFLSLNGSGTSPTASSTTETGTISAKPASGQTYSFTPPVPTAPTNLTFSGVTTTSMTLNWTDNSGAVEKGFAIYRSTDGITYNFVSQTAANVVTSTQSALTPNTNYYWKVYAVSEGGLSTAISGNQVTTLKTFTGTGNFSTAARWSGGTLPVAGENILIDGACTVDNNVGTDNILYGMLTIGSATGRTLNWAASGTNRLNVSNVAASSATSILDMTNGGTLVIRGTWTSTNLTFTPGAGKIEVQSPITLPAAYNTYNNLSVNGSGITVNLGVATTIAGNLSITAGTFSTNNFNVGIGGNWTNNGAFTPGTGTVTFNGTTVIGGTTTTNTFNNFTVATSSTVTSSTGIMGLVVNGTLTTGTLATLDLGATTLLSGTLGTISNAGTIKTSVPTTTSVVPIPAGKTWGGTIDYYNINGQTVAGGTYNNLTVRPGNSWTTIAGGNLVVNGALTVTTAFGAFDLSTYILSGTLTGIVNNGDIRTSVPTTTSATPIPTGKNWGGTIYYNAAAGAQTIVAGTYNILVNNNTSGTNTAAGDLTVTSQLKTTTGGTLDMGTAYRLINGGTITNNGTIKTSVTTATSTTPLPYTTWNGTGTVEYAAATGAQTVRAGVYYNNLKLSNTSGTNTIDNNVAVGGILSFSGGTITTGTYYLYIGATGTVSRPGTGHVVGNFWKYITTGAVSKTFEIGDAGNYTPVTITFASVRTAGDIHVSVTNTDHPNLASSGISATKSLNRYWTIVNSGIVFTTASLTMNWVAGDVDAGANSSNYKVGNYNSPNWTFPSFISPLATSIQATGLGSFGDFAVGECSLASGFSYTGSSFCNNGGTATPSITGTAGTFTSTSGLSINSTTGVVNLAASAAGTYTVTNTTISSGGCTSSSTATILITALPSVSATSTASCVGGSTGTITASGSGGTTPYTYSLNAGTYQSPVTFTGLSAGTYTLNIKSNAGCIASTSVTVSDFVTSTDDENATATDSWIGHVYDGTAFNNYIGHFTELQYFDELFGGDVVCFNVVSNSVTRSIYTETFSLKYKMNSTKRGLYVADLGSDDGSRLTVDGTMIYNNWSDQGFTTKPSVLMNLNGSSSLLYEFYENGGGNEVKFNNFTQVLANTLSTNTAQTICIGNTGSAISGDAYGVLPSGITLSGTGYQWTFSTSPGGARTNIAGATGATFSPSTNIAPFNTVGSYYIYRNAVLSSANNVSPNPYVGGNESNAATIIVSVLPSATVSYSGSPFCKSVATAQPVTQTGTTGGIYSSTAGLSINASTGAIIPGTSTAGTYAVTYTMAAAGGCTAQTATTSVTITVLPAAVISYSGSPFCSSVSLAQSVTQTGTTGGTYSSTAGLSINASTGAIVPGTSAAGIYTVTYTMAAAGGCTAQIATTSVTITPMPAATISYGGTAFCNSLSTAQPVTLTGTAGAVYSSTAGLTINAVTGAIIPSTSTPGVYTVTYTMAAAGGCSVQTATTSVTITTIPSATISYSGSPFCNSLSTAQPVTLTGTTGGVYSSTAGLTINAGTGAITPGTSTAGVYNVTYTLAAAGGCSTQTATTSVTITVVATATVSYSGTPFCSSINTGQPVTLTGTTGGTFTSTAGLAINAGTGAITPATSSAGTYSITYTMSAAGGCSVQTASSSVTITRLPAAIISYSSSSFCKSLVSAQPVTQTGTTGGLYSSVTGLTINTATGAITPGTSTPGAYTVIYTMLAAGGCTTQTAATTVTITAVPAATISYSGSPFCTSINTGQSVTLTGTAGGTFTSTAGLAINAGTGAVIPGASSAGTYTVTYTVSAAGGCSAQTATATVTIATAPNATISYTSSPYMANAGTATVNLSGTTGGTYTSSAGLSINAATGDVSLSASTPGTYTVTYTVSAAGGCSVHTTTANITIVVSIKTFTGTGNFSDASKWTGGTLPVAGEDLIIDGACTINNNAGTDNIAYGNLTIGTATGRTLNWITAGTNRLNISNINAGSAANTLDMTNGGILVIRGGWASNNLSFIPGAGTINIQVSMTLPAAYTTYKNIIVNGSGIIVGLAVQVTIAGNITIASGTLNANNFGINVKANWTNNVSTTAFTAGTGIVTFNGTTAQTIGGSSATYFNNLNIANTAGAVTLNVNAIIEGDLSVSGGIFDLGAFTANRTNAGGILTVANNAVLKIGGTNTFPTNFGTNTLVVASTVEYSGSNQNVANQLYGNLSLSSSSGAAIKTFPATAFTVVGNLSSTLGSGTSVSFTAASNLTINGNISIGNSTTFNGSSYSHSIGGNWVNNGIFNGNSSTVMLTGPGSVVSGTGSQNFNNLTVAASQVSFSSNSFSLSGNLATISSGSFTQVSGGTLTMTGSGKAISGSGISLENLTVTGSVTTGTSVAISGNLFVTGSITASTGTITMAGISKTISGAGTKNFNALSVTGTITTAVDFIISSALVVSGSLTASNGTATFTGVSSFSGTANLFNITVNGSSLQLSANSNVGIANVMTITAGSLNTTSSIPNIVNFNGSGSQNINAITYCNLVLSNGNTKTALGAITTTYDLTIAGSTTFNPGAYTLSIFGNWNNFGTFIPATSTVQFSGPSTAYLTGATTFNILNSNTSNSTTELILNNSVSATTVNMIKGIISTGVDTITITGTRTGAGYIYGHIRRMHAFTTGVAYAFEGPENTILFSAVSSVTSIIVSVNETGTGDFPYGNSISRTYNIVVPAGTYTATLRLHYEDDELNGNSESDMGLWNYDGTQWLPVGKTANSSTANYLEQSGLTNISNRWTCSINPSVVLWNGSVSSDWNTAANWTVYVGTGSTPPSSSDVVVVGGLPFTYQPSISTAASVKNLVFGSVPIALTMAIGGSLTSGDIQGVWGNDATHTINVNNQAITVNGNLSLSDGVTGHAINVNIGTGTLNIVGSLNESGAANIIFTGAGNLNISDNFNYVNGTFTAGSGTVTYNGIDNQAIGAVNYNNLTINNSAALVAIHYPFTINGNLSIIAGELDNYAFTNISGDVNISAGAALHNSDMMHVGGNWNNAGSYIGTGAHIKFDGNGTQTISATTFNNLIIDKPVGSSAILTGNVFMNGDLTVTSGTLNIKSFTCDRTVSGGTLTLGDSATFIVGANNAPAVFSIGNISNSSTVIADGTGPQYIFSGTNFGNFILRNGGTKTLVTPLTVNGDLTIEGGASFDGSYQTIILNGNMINNGTFTPTGGTVICNGTAKNISGNTTFNRLSVYGSYTFLNNNTINSLLIINPTGSLSGGAGITTTMNGDLVNKGVLYTLGTTTFTGNVLQTLSLINAVQTVAITVNFNGSVSPVLNSTSPPQYGYLNINNTGGVNPSVGWTIAYALTIGSGASFNGGPSTHNILGSLTNNGTITSNGILNFLPASAVTVNLGTNFSSTGRVIFGGAGAMTMAGTPVFFHNVQISNTNSAGITPASDWVMTNNFKINSGSILNAGNHSYFVGGDLSNTGTINSGTSTFILDSAIAQDIYSLSPLNNLTINKAAGITTLSSNATVNGVLNVVKGNISTGTNQVIITASGSVSGAGNSTGWVSGKLTKYIGTGTITKQFEIGDSTNYTPVTTAFTGITTGGSLTASTTAGDQPNIANSGLIATKSVNRYWTLTNSFIAPVQYNATFNFTGPSAGSGDIDAGVDTARLVVKSYDNAWLSTTAGTKSATTTEAIGITTFGDFQIAELTCVAPAIGNITVTNAICHGNSDGAISIDPVGGTGPFTYAWSNGAVTQNISDLPAGDYAVTITASGGCSVSSDMITVAQPAILAAPISDGDQVVCFNGDPEQTIIATATADTVTWYDAPADGNIVESPILTGVGTHTYYAEASNGTCISGTRTAVTLTINDAPASPVSGGDQTVCSTGDTEQTITATTVTTGDITWYDASSGGNIVNPEQVGIGSNTFYAAMSNGTCFSPTRTAVTLTINPTLAKPDSISGPRNVCEIIGSTTPTTYSVNPVAGTNFYTWHIPSGTTMVSGQGTTSIHVIFDSSFELTHSMFTVTASSSTACTSAASKLEVLKIVPAIPTAINGPLNVCAFVGQQSTAVYSIVPVINATSYTWTVSEGAVIISGQGTLSIAVSFADTFSYGSIKVTANSNCGSRAPRSISISKTIPAVPGLITGTTNACQYMGTVMPVSYSIHSVTGASSYLWTVPANVTLVSGQGTTNITVMFNSGFTTSFIKVRSVVSCGTSSDRSLLVVAATGGQPGLITGPNNACAFMGTGSAAIYSIRKVINAASYIWSLPAGATITSHPGGTAENDTIVAVTFNNNFVSGTKISVQAVICLPGVARTFAVSRVLPSKPGLIEGSTNVCPFMVSAANPTGIPVTYSIQKITGAASYLWIAPEGATITAHSGGLGINDTIIGVTFDSDFIRGTLTVAVVNGCGPGTARSLSISRLVTGAVGSVEVVQIASCPNRRYTYSLVSIPLNTTSILWTIPSNATLVSGQGTSSITVSYPSTNIAGSISARPFNNCSSGNARVINVQLPACAGGTARIALDDQIKMKVPPVLPALFETRIFPNPAVGDFKIEVLTASREMLTIKIFDMAGNELKKNVTESNEMTFNGNELKKGIYLIEVIQGSNKRIQKFVKL